MIKIFIPFFNKYALLNTIVDFLIILDRQFFSIHT
jgi:hypothetical protein